MNKLMNDFYRSDDNKEQTSNTILRSVENMPEFESRPPQEQRIDSENIAEANTYDEMPTLPKDVEPTKIDSIHLSKTNAYEDMDKKLKVEESKKMDSTHHTQPNAYEDMGPKFKVKQSLKKTTEENVKDSNINIYESMKEQACGNTPTEDPLRDIKLKNPAENKTVLYESMKMSAQ
ncbi:Hypothetical predicted protein, partial [Mytilus galloprovincialis]